MCVSSALCGGSGMLGKWVYSKASNRTGIEVPSVCTFRAGAFLAADSGLWLGVKSGAVTSLAYGRTSGRELIASV